MLKNIVVKGVNGSKAVSNDDGYWTVTGAHDVLDEQKDDELAYKADLSWDKIIKLPKNTPIYAPVSSFKPKIDNVADDFATVGDFLESAKSCIKAGYDCLKEEEKKRVNIKHITFDMISDIANRLFEELTWQSINAYEDDFANDISESIDSYEILLAK